MPTIEFEACRAGDGRGSVAERMGEVPLEVQDGERPWRLFYLQGGMRSGKPSVMLAVRKDDGTWFLCETSAGAFLGIEAAVRGAAEHDGWAL